MAEIKPDQKINPSCGELNEDAWLNHRTVLNDNQPVDQAGSTLIAEISRWNRYDTYGPRYCSGETRCGGPVARLLRDLLEHRL